MSLSHLFIILSRALKLIKIFGNIVFIIHYNDINLVSKTSGFYFVFIPLNSTEPNVLLVSWQKCLIPYRMKTVCLLAIWSLKVYCFSFNKITDVVIIIDVNTFHAQIFWSIHVMSIWAHIIDESYKVDAGWYYGWYVRSYLKS